MQVVETITKLIDRLTICGELAQVDVAKILENQSNSDPSPKDLIINELLVNERSHLSSLENLVKLKEIILSITGLSNDALTRISSSLTPIVNSQRRLFLGMEKITHKISGPNNWARLFKVWSDISMSNATFTTSQSGTKEYIRPILAKGKRF